VPPPRRYYPLIVVGVTLLVTLGLMVFLISNDRYLETVAISCLGPALAWFALGREKTDDEVNRED